MGTSVGTKGSKGANATAPSQSQFNGIKGSISALKVNLDSFKVQGKITTKGVENVHLINCEFTEQAKIALRTKTRKKPHQNDQERKVNLSGLQFISTEKVPD